MNIVWHIIRLRQACQGNSTQAEQRVLTVPRLPVSRLRSLLTSNFPEHTPHILEIDPTMSDIEELVETAGWDFVPFKYFPTLICPCWRAVITQSLDDGDHDEPFDVTAVPRPLAAEDAPSQQEVEAAIYGHSDDQPIDHIMQFKSLRASSVSFNRLQHMKETSDRKGAMRLLSSRHRLEIDDEYKLDPTDRDTVVASGPHYLDFVMYIGARRGLDAVLPNVEVDGSWFMEFDTSMTMRLWPQGKSSKLPFDAHGRLLYIGKVRQEQVWISMVPNEWLQPDHPFNATGNWPVLRSRTTAMESDHASMVLMFIAKTFSDRRLQDFHCHDEYPWPLTRQSVNESTEILWVFHLDAFRWYTLLRGVQRVQRFWRHAFRTNVEMREIMRSILFVSYGSILVAEWENVQGRRILGLWTYGTSTKTSMNIGTNGSTMHQTFGKETDSLQKTPQSQYQCDTDKTNRSLYPTLSQRSERAGRETMTILI